MDDGLLIIIISINLGFTLLLFDEFDSDFILIQNQFLTKLQEIENHKIEPEIVVLMIKES